MTIVLFNRHQNLLQFIPCKMFFGDTILPNQEKNANIPILLCNITRILGGLNVVDMLLALSRITVETWLWYIKVLWHLVKIGKVNGRILYDRRYTLKSLLPKDILSLLNFSTELSDTLIHANKPSVIKVDLANKDKKQCRQCQAYYRMLCSKCNASLCLIKELIFDLVSLCFPNGFLFEFSLLSMFCKTCWCSHSIFNKLYMKIHFLYFWWQSLLLFLNVFSDWFFISINFIFFTI